MAADGGYLTWCPGRNRVWTEHTGFPHKAIKWWRDYPWASDPFKIYYIHPGRDTITLIPESEWDDHS